MPRISPEAIAKGKERASARINEHRRRLGEIKEQAQCVDCGPGVWWPYFVLQFDHLPEHEKGFEVSRRVGKAWETVLAEISKCEVVCASHHAIRTHSRLSP